MAGLGAIISNLIFYGTSLLPTIRDSIFAPSSSSSSSSDHESKLQAIEKDLTRLMRMLKRIQATMSDAERREIRDESVQLWLKELREVAYDADDVLDEWRYEQIKAQVEARSASDGNPKKRKLIQIPDGLADQIKEIMCRFDEISKDHEALHLREEDGKRIPKATFPIPTSHVPHESSILGRTNEKEEVINRLLSNCDKNNVNVLPIVGMGGLGKTTLAQLVYNDERIRQQFDNLGWVWVFNDFDVKRLTKAILETVSRDGCDLTELSLLQEKLNTEVTGKSVFLVLDDVWNDQLSHWQRLMAPLYSAKRVSILVTTRNQSVALILQTIPFFQLDTLPDDQCWQIFQHYALGGFPNIEHSNFTELGRKIIKKCAGLPLAVKSIASQLKYLKEERWEEILQSEIWEAYPEEAYPENEAFAALRISYMQLSEHLKSCLLFCSIFPKGYFYTEDKLINLWIAQDYVVSTGKMSMEQVGMEYVKELRQRSFLDVAYTDEDDHSQTYKIHDIVHDLLRSISKGAHREINRDTPVITTDEICRHLFVKDNSVLVVPHFSRMLRTLILNFEYIKTTVYDNDLSYVQKLRVLEMYFLWLGSPDHFSLDPIGRMKHLRHLVLKFSWVDKYDGGLGLSDDDDPICQLFNSRYLSRLHNYEISLEPICQLFNLRFLSFDGYASRELPKELGNLANLKSLSFRDCGIESLPDTFSLLSNLEKLYLESCGNLNILPENFGKLVSLRKLSITDCPLEAFPDSLCELINLKILRFSNQNIFSCLEPTKLPEAIGNLSSLQELHIDAFINHLPPSFNKIYNSCRSREFVRLEVEETVSIGWLKDFGNLNGALCFKHLSHLIELDEVQQDILVAMQNLQELVVSWGGQGCSITKIDNDNVLYVSTKREGLEGRMYSEKMPREGLEGRMYSEKMPLSILESLQPHPNLKRLALIDYPGNTLPAWMGDPFVCASLHTIKIWDCHNINSLPFGNLRSLRNVDLFGCDGLSSLHEDSLPSLLEKLDIRRCDNLVSMPVLWKLKSLVELTITRCPNLRPSMMESDCAANYWLPQASCSVKIRDCDLELSLRPYMVVEPDYWWPQASCSFKIEECPLLKEYYWCFTRHYP